MANRFTVETIFQGVDRTSGVLSGMSAKARAFEKSLQSPLKSAADIAEKPLGVMKQVAAAGLAAGVAAGAVFSDLVATGADFEKTMIAAGAKFSPAIRQGTKEFAELQATAEEVGAKTEFNAQQAAAGLKDLASAGFNAKQAIQALPGVVDLATASEVDLGAASEMATKSLGAFNLKTDDAAQLSKNLSRINDVMSRTADATSASMEGLFQTILEGAPVATTAGASVETFMAMAGQLAQSGIEASVAGTTLKNVFLTLAAPSKEAASALSTLGIKTQDAKGNMRDAVAILGDLEMKTAKMGTAKKADVIESIFGKIPIAGVSALLGGGMDKVAALRGELEKAGGSTARMAAIMRDSTKNDIDGFTSAIDGVKIAVFNVAKGPFRDITQRVTEWTTANKDFIATKFDEFLKGAIPVVENFGDGVKDSFTDAKPAIVGVKDALLGMFGGDSEDSPRQQAYALANGLTDATLALGAFWLATKAASAATFVYGVVTKVATGATWAVQGAVAAVKWMTLSHDIGAATASTWQAVSASASIYPMLLKQRMGAFAASGGMLQLAKTTGAAAAAFIALAIAKDQNDKLEKENAGMGIGDLMWGSMTQGTVDEKGQWHAKSFFSQVDDKMNADAKADLKRRQDARKAAAEGKPSAAGSPALDIGTLNSLGMAASPEALAKGIAALEANSGQLPPGMMAGLAGFPMAPVGPAAPGGKQVEPQIALKDESATKISQNLSRDVSAALKGVVEIKIRDKGRNADVSSSTGSGVSVTQSGVDQ